MFLKLTGKGNWLVWVLLTGVLYVFTLLMVGIGWGLFSYFFSGLASPACPKILLVGLIFLPITLIFREIPLACLRFFIQWLPVNFVGQKSLTTKHYNQIEHQITKPSASFASDKKTFFSTKLHRNYQPEETTFFSEEEKEVWNRLLNEPNLEEKELLQQAKLFLAKKKKKKDNPPG